MTRDARAQAGLFGLALALYLVTIYPSFYTFDSAELAIGAATLGIVHSPGYALYLLVGQLFSWLPIGDVGFRLNLLSALCTALTVPILWTTLRSVVADKRSAALASLVFVLVPAVWHNGTITEVYAAQTLTLCIVMWALARLRTRRTLRDGLAAGAAYGVAVAMHPSSALFAPAVAAAFVALRLSWKTCASAALLSALLFAASLAYFPLRQPAQPRMNFAGQYNDAGTFEQVDLTTFDGIVWLVRGDQFDGLFFYEGVLPSAGQLIVIAHALWTTYQGIGLLVIVLGVFRMRPSLILIWLLAFLPYTYFYTTYGAPDRPLMLGPAYLLLSLPLAFGFTALSQRLRAGARVLLLLLPLLMALHSLRAVAERALVDVRSEASEVIAALPQDALVFGVWGDIVTLEYLQILEGQRPDLDLRNLFFFDSEAGVLGQIARESADLPGRPLVFLSDLVPTGLDARRYTIYPLRSGEHTQGFIFVPRE